MDIIRGAFETVCKSYYISETCNFNCYKVCERSILGLQFVIAYYKTKELNNVKNGLLPLHVLDTFPKLTKKSFIF